MFYPCSGSQALALPSYRAFSALASRGVKGKGSTSNAYSPVPRSTYSLLKMCVAFQTFIWVCIKTNSHQALLQTGDINLLWEISISHNAETLASSLMNSSTRGKWCGLGYFFSPGILCRQLRISPHELSAVCQITPYHIRKLMLNKRCQDKKKKVNCDCHQGNAQQGTKWASQGTSPKMKSCQTQRKRKTRTQEERQSQSHHEHYHHCIRDCSFRNRRTRDIPIHLPVKQKDSRLLCGLWLLLGSALRRLILNQEPRRQLFPTIARCQNRQEAVLTTLKTLQEAAKSNISGQDLKGRFYRSA